MLAVAFTLGSQCFFLRLFSVVKKGQILELPGRA